jgi:hypothetical protein
MFKILDILFEPRFALIIFIAILVGYLIFLDKENAFQTKFLRFGPSPDTKFLNIKLDAWAKVIAVYFIALLSSLSSAYYSSVTSSYISGVLLNPAYKDKIQQSKFWSKVLVAIDPIMSWVMQLFQLFATLTLELQYMLPQLLGHLAIFIPANLYTLETKRFSFD